MSEVHILEAIDREIAFYRRRAGQVFFLGLTVEVLILAGRERIVVPAAWPWIQPLSYGVLFIAVAAVGILLGREYRGRIHVLKRERKKLAGDPYDPLRIPGHADRRSGGVVIRVPGGRR